MDFTARASIFTTKTGNRTPTASAISWSKSKASRPKQRPPGFDLKTGLEAVQELQRQLALARTEFASDSPEVKALQKQLAAARALFVRSATGDNSDSDLTRVDALPTQARTRVTDFWGGVYKQFALRGPATF